MSQLSFRDRELVALGAALASNCVPCIEYHVTEAGKAGLSAAEIREAVELADKIKKVPASKVLETAQRLLDGAAPAGAGCNAPAPSPAGNACSPQTAARPACC